MRIAAAAVVLIGLVTVPLAAQGRGGRDDDRAQGVPRGQLPPPGQCRVWYDGRPPGQQPAPTNCREAERIAARDRDARVIYGGEREGRDDGRWDRDDDRRDRPRAIPRRSPSRDPDRDRNERGEYDYERVPFDNGYKDGYDKGREDVTRNISYDPARHRWYRSADRGYSRRYGSRDEYANVYRDGFRAGYEDGYRDSIVHGSDRRRGGIRWPWPF